MRPRNQAVRDQLLPTLKRLRRASATQLAQALHIAVPTVHKLLAELPPDQVLSAGLSRRTRYAARRPLRGVATDIPLYAISPEGEAALVSGLALVYPEGTLLPMNHSGWPVPPASRDGWWDGLPFPIYDMRPQGYLGRNFARVEHERLGVPQNPNDWTDDDVVYALSRAGSDTPGNLLLGEEAYSRWLHSKLAPVEMLVEGVIGEQYAELAHNALTTGVAASSAAGEFPKFTAVRQNGQATPHVLVKFSGAGNSAAERRLADLLVCEHFALECSAGLPGVTSARTRIVAHAGRVFLEAERFDRVGLHGRLPVCTLDALNAAFLGSASTDWSILVSLLHRENLIDSRGVQAANLLWWYGRLIANTDMHLGNLSFYILPTLGLAPTYDMVPMAYAPLPGGEVPPHQFAPQLPQPPQQDTWRTACASAVEFWRRASADVRISEQFRSVCAANGHHLTEIMAAL